MMFNVFMCVGVFKIPFRGNYLVLFFVSGLFLFTSLGIGLLISTKLKNQFLASQVALSLGFLPAVLLSGFISPIEDMPVFLQRLTLLNPIRFFMQLTRGIFLKGMGVHDVIVNLIPLILIAIITLSLAGWTFKQKLD